MARIATTLALLLWASPLSAGPSSNFERASIQGAVGEASNLYVIPEGVYFHPFYNDINGATDKLLTGSMKVGLLTTFSPFSLEATATWRLLTPAVQPTFLRDEFLDEPVGIYADWRELETAVAHSLHFQSISIKNQLSAGFNHIGNKGGRELHRGFHRLIGSSLENLEYINMPNGYFPSYDYMVGLFHKLASSGHASTDHQIAIGSKHDKMLSETYIRYNLLRIFRKNWWETALELRFIHQTNSEVYESIRQYRFEVSASSRLYKYFAPTVKYITPYLNGDHIGQTYFDILHFNYPF